MKAPAHLGNVVHEVHARLVGLGVRQLQKRGHPEADGVRRVAALNRTRATTFNARGQKQNGLGREWRAPA